MSLLFSGLYLTYFIICSNRSEKAKLDEELTDLNRTVTELTSESGDAAIQRLEDEINDCKAILKCGVCCDRPKEVLTFVHLFHRNGIA